MRRDYQAWLNGKRQQCKRLKLPMQGTTLEVFSSQICRPNVELSTDPRINQLIQFSGDFILITQEIISENKDLKSQILSLNKEKKDQQMKNIQLEDKNRNLKDEYLYLELVLSDLQKAIGPDKIKLIDQNKALKEKSLKFESQLLIKFRQLQHEIEEQKKQNDLWFRENTELRHELLWNQIKVDKDPSQGVNRRIPPHPNYISNRLQQILEVNPISQLSRPPLNSDFYHIFRNEEGQIEEKVSE